MSQASTSMARLLAVFLGRTLVALFAACGTVGGQTSPTRATPTLDELIEAIKVQESFIQNIMIRDFSMRISTRTAMAGEWKDDAFSAAGTAWLSGTPASKSRIHFSLYQLALENGSSPVGRSVEDAAYDGKFGRVAIHERGTAGEMHKLRLGLVTAEVPEGLTNFYINYGNGSSFALAYLRVNGATLSDFLTNASHANSAQILSETIEGRSLVAVRMGTPPQPVVKYYFDPEKNYVLTRTEKLAPLTRTNGIDISEIENVEAFKEVAPGRWYPISASREQQNYQTHGRLRINYTAKDVVANDPNFSDAIYTLVFPDGYRVDDRAHNVSFVAGPEANALQLQLNEQLVAARVDPAPPPQTSVMSLLAAEGPQPLPSRFPSPIVLVLMGTGVLGLVFVLWHFSRRSKRQASQAVSSLLLLIAFSSALVLATSSVFADGNVSSERAILQPRQNCGLNCFYLLSNWYSTRQTPMTIEEAAKQLKVGEDFANVVSLGDIKRGLETQGLRVVGLHADAADDILHAVPPGSASIVRLKKVLGEEDLGHFVVFAATSTSYVLLDAPRTALVVSKDDTGELMARLGKTSGEFLTISPPPESSSQLKTEKLLVPDTVVDLGEIGVNVETFVGKVILQNIGTDVLNVTDVITSCGCQKVERTTYAIKPGASEAVPVTFNRRELPIGAIERQIAIATDDPERPKFLVFFKFVIKGAPTSANCAALPIQWIIGKVSPKQLLASKLALEVLLPTGEVLARGMPVVRVTDATGSLACSVGTADAPKIASHIKHTTIPVEVSWRDLPSGGQIERKLNIEIAWNDGKMDTLAVPVFATVTTE